MTVVIGCFTPALPPGSGSWIIPGMGRGAAVALAWICAVATGCTAARPAGRAVSPSSPQHSASLSAESKFAPFVADPGRRSLVPLTTGVGSRVFHLERYFGDFEIDFQCLGRGSAVYQLDGVVQRWRCGEPVLDEEKTASRGPLASLMIHAAPSQRWQVLVQAGHTPAG